MTALNLDPKRMAAPCWMKAVRFPMRPTILLLSLLLSVRFLGAQTATDPGIPDLTTRETARTWYNTNWEKTYGAAMNFTGDVPTGNAGDISTAFREQALLRYNMFRRMVGSQPFVLDDAKNHKAQLAAMVIAANNKMAHGIDSTWKFYSAETNKATQDCDEALEYVDPGAVLAYIYDYGAENAGGMGHRQDVILPYMDPAVGLGNVAASTTTKKAQAFAVDITEASLKAVYDKPFVPWPAIGYVPNYLITGPWSIFVPDKITTFAVTLKDVKISVTRNGVAMNVKGRGQSDGSGAIWTLDGTTEGNTDYGWFTLSNGETYYGRPNSTQDVVYHVVLEGIRYRVPKTYYGYLKDGVSTIYDNRSNDYGTLVMSYTEDTGTGAPYNGTGRYEYDVIGYNSDLTTKMAVVTAPASQVVTAGGMATLFVEASGVATYQWYKDGVAVAGATNPWLQFTGFNASQVGRYHALMTSVNGALLSGYADLGLSTSTTQKLSNLSTRSVVGVGDQVQIAGFVISGDKPKTVLLRASGPALAAYGVAGTLADPVLTLFDSANAQIATNDNWTSDVSKASLITAAASQAGAFAWASGSKDAALMVTLQPGRYTAQVSGKNETTGIALIEAYDMSDTGSTRLFNLSSRTLVKEGDDIQIAGFVISGDKPKTLLIRASGPALAAYGVSGTLDDPVLALYDSAGAKLQTNTDWSTDGTQATLIEQAADKTGAFAWSRGSKDAALLVTLPPGRYSAQVAGQNGGTGVAIVEVYEVN